MDCIQFREMVHDLDRPGTQAYSLRAAALEHAESCRACSLLLEKVECLDFALAGLMVKGSEGQAPARMEAALLAEFRRQHAESMRPRRNFRLAALAAAAVLILAFGIGLRHWNPHKTVATNSGAGVSNPQAGTVVNPGADATVADDTESSDADLRYATNFVSLPYADDPGTLDGGTIVRVTVSRSTLASMGMPVADMGNVDQIPADIALSEDGVPQAIRLVAARNLDQTD